MTLLELGTVLIAAYLFTWVCWLFISKELEHNDQEYEAHVQNFYELYLFWKGIREHSIPFTVVRFLKDNEVEYLARSETYSLLIKEKGDRCTFCLKNRVKGVIMINTYIGEKDNSQWIYHDVPKGIKHDNEYSLHHMFLEGARSYWELKKWKRYTLKIDFPAQLPAVLQAKEVADPAIQETLDGILGYYLQLQFSHQAVPSFIFKKYTQNILQTIETMLEVYLSLTPYYQQEASQLLHNYLLQIKSQYQNVCERYVFYLS